MSQNWKTDKNISFVTQGTTEVFLDGLPGTPDNLNLSPDGNILIALVSVRLPGEFDPLEFMFKRPWLRKIVIRLMHIIKFPFDLVSTFFDIPIFRQIRSHVRLIFSFVIFKKRFASNTFFTFFLGHEFKPTGTGFTPVLNYR